MAVRTPFRNTLSIFGSLVFVTLYQQSRLFLSGFRAFGFHEIDQELLDHPYKRDAEDGVIDIVSTATPKPFRRWAYAFLIGGCSNEKPEYRGFLYNALVAAEKLQEFGSQADVVVMIQMSMHTNETRLPDHETKALEAMNVSVHYIPKVRAKEHEIFYSLVQEKFRILSLTSYSRVLFLDGDIMPVCNMDYLFDLSEPEQGPPMLKENVVLSWRKEAANAGFFMLAPNAGDYARLNEDIKRKETKALDLPWPHWDEVEGWGHVIEEPDYWRTEDGVRGKNWTWHAVFADQGLLYYWTKYVKKSVSLIIGKEIENWGYNSSGLVLEETLYHNPLNSLGCSEHVDKRSLTRKPSPYRDFVHFTGRAKPWEPMNYLAYVNATDPEIVGNRKVNTRLSGSTRKWFEALETIEHKTKMSFNFEFATGKLKTNPPVGRFSDYGQMIKHIKLKAANNWTHYE